MRFLKKHYDKILLAVFVLAVCIWGLHLFVRVANLQEKVTHAEPGPVSGERMEELARENFNAEQLLEADRAAWSRVERQGRASLIRPPSLIWCVNQACSYWLPVDTEVCPYCGTDQGDAAAQVIDDPDLPPPTPLSRRLFLVGISRQPFGAVLRRVTAIPGEPPERVDLQIEVYDETGERRTRFTQKGDSIRVRGVEYTIAEVHRKEETVFNPQLNVEETIDVSEVTLVGPGERRVVLIRGQQTFVGPRRVRFLLTDPRDPRIARNLAVDSNQILTVPDLNGTPRRYSIEVQSENLVLLRPEGQPEAQPVRIRPRPTDSPQAMPGGLRPGSIPDRFDPRGMPPEMLDQAW